MKWFFVFAFFMGSFGKSAGQNPDSLALPKVDSTVAAKIDSADAQPKAALAKFFKSDYPNPRKAALLSLFPGGGQIYNKKYWWIKVPVIYGGLISLGLVADFNEKEYQCYRDAYVAELNGLPHKYSDRPVPYSAATLKTARDIYDKRRQQTYIGITAVYLANIFEAYVAAHLLEFDVNEDLSLKIRPSYQQHATGGNSVGLGLQLGLR